MGSRPCQSLTWAPGRRKCRIALPVAYAIASRAVVVVVPVDQGTLCAAAQILVRALPVGLAGPALMHRGMKPLCYVLDQFCRLAVVVRIPPPRLSVTVA